jgi:hypothetical protein
MSIWIRQIHRWLAVAFTLGFAVNFVAWRHGQPAMWIVSLFLIPMFLLLVSGLYLFVLPYAIKAGARRRTA